MESFGTAKCVIRRRYLLGESKFSAPTYPEPQSVQSPPAQPAPSQEPAANYLLGRARPLPEIVHVPEPEKQPHEPAVPEKLRRFSLYAAPPEELAKRILTKARESHMQNSYFKRGKKKAKEESGTTTKAYVRRKKKIKSSYVTKAAKLSNIQHELTPRAVVIERLLKST